MKKSIYLLLPAFVVLSCSKPAETLKTQPSSTDAVPVKIQPITAEEVSPVVQTSGLFTTDDETFLAFKTGGVIEKVFAKEGDAIRKGQLLATLNLTEIEAQVAQAKLAYEKAKRDHARVENLFRDSVATLEQFQNARTGLEVASRQLEAASFNKSYSEIRAIGNGFVLRKLASEGQVISPGSPVFLTNGAGNGRWILRTGVSDREWAAIQIGDDGFITTDARPGESFVAKVTRKSEGTDAMSGSFTVELTIKNARGLASGMFGKATIRASRKQKAWKIPYQALLDGDGRTGFVFVTNDDKTAKRVAVVIDRIEKDHVVIVSGLEQQGSLIVSGSAYLKDVSHIRLEP
jgi:RND family efflux transporter MFP subunit